jgi:hypothetical protein
MASENANKWAAGGVLLVTLPILTGLLAGWGYDRMAEFGSDAYVGGQATLALATGVMFGFAFGLSIFMRLLAPRGAGENLGSVIVNHGWFWVSLWGMALIMLVLQLGWLFVPEARVFTDTDWIDNDIPLLLAFGTTLLWFFVVATMYLFAIALGIEFRALGKKFKSADSTLTDDTRWDAETFSFVTSTIRWTGVAILLMFFVLIVATSFNVIDGTVSLADSMKTHPDAPLEGMLDFFAQTKIVMFLFLGWSVAVLIAFVGNITGGTGPKAMTLFSMFALLYFIMVFALHEPFLEWLTDDFAANGFGAFIAIVAAGVTFFFISNFIAASVITMFLLSFAGSIKSFRSFRKEDAFRKKGYARYVAQIPVAQKHKVNRDMRRKLGRK